MRLIADVAATLGLRWDDLEPYGRGAAKVPLAAFPAAARAAPLVVVTATNADAGGRGQNHDRAGAERRSARDR